MKRKTKETLFSTTRLECKCVLRQETDQLREALQQTNEIIHTLQADAQSRPHSKNLGQLKKRIGKTEHIVKELQKIARNLRQQEQQHVQFRKEYARDMVDLVKKRAINVGPAQKRLKTVPWLVGMEKTRQQEEDAKYAGKKGRKKKQKTKK
jgi:hypothetical protein